MTFATNFSYGDWFKRLLFACLLRSICALLLLASPLSLYASPHKTSKKTAAKAKQGEQPLVLRSESVLIQDVESKEILVKKNPEDVRPIASVTKLLSGLLLLNKTPQAEKTALIEADKDWLKHARSHLRIGWILTHEQLMRAALGASDNRAMYAAVRNTGTERADFVKEMNKYAADIGMSKSAFYDPAGLDPRNVSTAYDLMHLLEQSALQPRIREYTQEGKLVLETDQKRVVQLINPNRLARSSRFDLVVGKTGYTDEAGRTLIARVKIEGRTLDMVFLGAHEKASVFGDAGRVQRFVLNQKKPATEVVQ